MTAATQNLTNTQYKVIQMAAARPSRALEPMPSNLRGAAKQSVLAALVAHGYAVKCHLPGHVEYVLSAAGLTACQAGCAEMVASGATA